MLLDSHIPPELRSVIVWDRDIKPTVTVSNRRRRFGPRRTSIKAQPVVRKCANAVDASTVADTTKMDLQEFLKRDQRSANKRIFRLSEQPGLIYPLHVLRMEKDEGIYQIEWS